MGLASSKSYCNFKPFLNRQIESDTKSKVQTQRGQGPTRACQMTTGAPSHAVASPTYQALWSPGSRWPAHPSSPGRRSSPSQHTSHLREKDRQPVTLRSVQQAQSNTLPCCSQGPQLYSWFKLNSSLVGIPSSVQSRGWPLFLRTHSVQLRSELFTSTRKASPSKGYLLRGRGGRALQDKELQGGSLLLP